MYIAKEICFAIHSNRNNIIVF